MIRQAKRLMIILTLVASMTCMFVLIYNRRLAPPSVAENIITLKPEEQNKYTKLATQFVPPGFDESKAVDVAIENSVRWKRSRAESKDTHDTLCVTFIKLPLAQTNPYMENMKNEGTKKCTWLYIVYKYDDPIKDQLLRDFKEQVASNFVSRTILDQPNYDVVFAPPRQEIIASIYDTCKSMQHTDYFSMYQMSESCKELEAAVITMHTAAGIAQEGNYNALVYPKVLLFMQILPYLEKFRFVWLIDGDISLQGFDLSNFLSLMHCTLPIAPLIAQPLIHQNTQTYKYLNKKSWAKSRAIAAQTGFVEVQVPLMDAALMRYFLFSFVLPIVIPAHILGADWGFDSLFCSVAKLYHAVTSPQFTHLQQSELPENTLLLGQNLVTQRSFTGAPVGNQAQALKDLLTNRALFKITPEAEKSIIAVHGEKLARERSATQRHIRAQLVTSVLDSSSSVCGVVVGAGAVHHDNKKETNVLLGYEAKKNLNAHMMSIVESTYPLFYKTGKGATVDPLHKDSKLIKSEVIDSNCEFRIK